MIAEAIGVSTLASAAGLIKEFRESAFSLARTAAKSERCTDKEHREKRELSSDPEITKSTHVMCFLRLEEQFGPMPSIALRSDGSSDQPGVAGVAGSVGSAGPGGSGSVGPGVVPVSGEDLVGLDES